MPATLHAQAKAPHLIAACVANVAAGSIQIVTGELPENIAATAPPYIAHMWSALLVLGGLTALTGMFIKDTTLGLRLEGAGHIGVFGGCGIYLVSALTWMPQPWWPSPAVWWALCLSMASLVRWIQIWKVMRDPRKALKEGR